MTASTLQPVPSRLFTPPSQTVPPPVAARLQVLPFRDLAWENFERLCLRLAASEAEIEYCQLYGTRGQDQQGIDFYARVRGQGEYRVYQCKRERAFGPAKINAAVKRFRNGAWATKATMLVLCTMESLVATERAEAFERQVTLLRTDNVQLEPWDTERLSLRLKARPEIVDDFFGREWVRVFCGEEAASRLGRRLDAARVAEFRRLYQSLYTAVFLHHDPGFPLDAQRIASPPPLRQRYVVPDIVDQRLLRDVPRQDDVAVGEVVADQWFGPEASIQGRATDFVAAQRPLQPHRRTVAVQRLGLEEWLIDKRKCVVLAGPGSGKSTLLRFMALDLLDDEPCLRRIVEAWGSFLPVWVPFGFWTSQIAAQPTGGPSLTQVLQRWLSSLDEDRLWPLLEQALEDRRLLLLVDGLDEWTSEDAAKIALHRLQVFITQHDVPTVLTSRPHGFAKLGEPLPGWSRGSLAALSPTQQRQLVDALCLSWQATTDPARQGDEQERRARARRDSFMTELGDVPQLTDLAGIPLLLTLLLYLNLSGQRLPRSRFKAYESLIALLLQQHPQRRRIAASTPAADPSLSDDDLREAMAHLAYHMISCSPAGLLDHRSAEGVLATFLTDPQQGVGLDQRDARQIARELLRTDALTTGLLVSKTQTDIGFFHRSLQDYLAGAYLHGRDPMEQREIVATHCAEPQWREVVLALLALTDRRDEVRSLVEVLRQRTCTPSERRVLDVLLCEMVTGEYACPADLAREIVGSAIQQIEEGPWLPHREQLLLRVLDGLWSARVRDVVEPAVRRWFPAYGRRESLYNLLATWPTSPAHADCLLHGLYDEEAGSQLAAGRALAQCYAADPAIGERLGSIALRATDPRARAAAIAALTKGWPQDSKLSSARAQARHDTCAELRVAAICAAVASGLRKGADFRELLRLASGEAMLSHAWDGEVVATRIQGWRGSALLKSLCLKSLRGARRRRHEIARSAALRVLLTGYPQDEDIVDYCVEEIKGEHPFVGEHEAWSWLLQHFRDNPRLASAIDEWLPRTHPTVDYQSAIAALIGRTSTAKALLLTRLDSEMMAHWYGAALLEGWGMDDDEVASRLTSVAWGPEGAASRIAHLLPQVITEENRCVQRLCTILNHSGCERVDSVIAGLGQMPSATRDPAIVDNILLLLDRLRPTQRQLGIAALIDHFSDDSRVRTLAEHEMNEPMGEHLIVGWAYRDDATIRRTLISRATPLSAPLRLAIAQRLTEGAGPPQLARELLGGYAFDPDAEVQTQAAIGYYTLLNKGGSVDDSAIAALRAELAMTGPLSHSCRQAAFCGAAVLERLDLIGQTDRDRIPIAVLGHNTALIRFILSRWDTFTRRWGSDFWYRRFIGDYGLDPMRLLEHFSIFASEGTDSPAREEFLTFLENQPSRKADPNVLRFLERTRPRSSLLLEYCFGTLGTSQRNDLQEEVVAAEILGHHFGGDQDVYRRLLSMENQGHLRDGYVLALCEGWPESDAVREWAVRADQSPYLYHYITRFILRVLTGSSTNVQDTLRRHLHLRPYYYLLQQYTAPRPLVRRVQTDDALVAHLLAALAAGATPSEKVTFARLLSTARGMSVELAEWCIAEVAAAYGGDTTMESGIDMFSGALVPVGEALLDLLEAATEVTLTATSMEL